MSKNFFKRTISYIIAISFIFSYIAYAEENTEEIVTREPEQAEFSYEPEIHVEEVDHWILLGDEDDNKFRFVYCNRTICKRIHT